MAKRGGFSGRLGFVAAAAGSAVGLGNIWKFPYETGENGGAAFLIIYVICTLVIGFPVMAGEMALGRHAQKDPFGSYKSVAGKSWALVGLFGVLCGLMILSFYNVVAGWAFGYFVEIASGNVLSLDSSQFGSHFGEFISKPFPKIFIYAIIFMAVTAFIVLQGVQKGIEKATKLLMPTLFLMLIGLIIYAFTLDGAMDGVKYYLSPDFSKVTPQTIFSAMGQAFFSLSLGMGALITYGSYFPKKENIFSSALIVTAVDITVAFLAGLLIFPLVFSQGMEPSSGPGLVFVALPTVFQSMGAVLGQVVGASFFLLLCVAALTSTVSLLEVPAAYLIDEKKMSRKKAVGILAGLIFLISLPSMYSFSSGSGFADFVQYYSEAPAMQLADGQIVDPSHEITLASGQQLAANSKEALASGVIATTKLVKTDKSFFDLIDDVFSNIGLPLGGFFLSIFVAYRWKKNNLADEMEQGFAGYKGSMAMTYLNFMLSYVCPLVLGLITIATVLQKFFGVVLF